ncbi:hypothetical protein DITRI_Ditri15bG0010000 [Diplodiscus trichospermus]
MEVVGAVVEVILVKVISLAAQQISLVLGFKEELTMLHDSLTVIKALLQDADKRIKKINASLNNISNQANLFGLQRRVPDMVLAPIGNQVTHSFLVDSSQVIGREYDVSKAVGLLINSTSHQALPVLLIVGMPGLGKTTLAKLVCKHE